MLKFERNALVSASGLQVEYRMKGGGNNPFTLTASKYGVSFNESPLLTDQTELQVFARVLSDAWVDHRTLKRGDTPGDRAHSDHAEEVVPSTDSPEHSGGSS